MEMIEMMMVQVLDGAGAMIDIEMTYDDDIFIAVVLFGYR